MASIKGLLRALDKAIENGHLYDNENYHKLLKQRRQLKELRERIRQDERSVVGFGYTQKPVSFDDYEELAESHGVTKEAIEELEAKLDEQEVVIDE